MTGSLKDTVIVAGVDNDGDTSSRNDNEAGGDIGRGIGGAIRRGIGAVSRVILFADVASQGDPVTR